MKAHEFLNYKNWVVVGDVTNSSKYAYKILNMLEDKEFNVIGVHPLKEGKKVYKNLRDVPFHIEVINLCINPILGIQVVEECRELGINKILIQPGAESDEIIEYCKKNGIHAVEGCTLVELATF